MTFLAHSPTEDTPEGQPLKEHLEQVAALSVGFCRAFDAEEDGRCCGLYHDLGKYSQAFQKRLHGDTRRVDHATAGAWELGKKGYVLAAMCVAGHHSGLLDPGTRGSMEDGTFMARIRRAKTGELEDYAAWRGELPDLTPGRESTPLSLNGKKTAALDPTYYFYTKMLYSALVDADWLDTEAYFRNAPYTPSATDISALLGRLTEYIDPWWNAQEPINRWRCQMLQAAIEGGKEEPGLFTMTIPTGGGKTVSSMAFALHHAAVHRMRRVIYVIPYCSILEQTRAVFDEIFGRENVVAHYSGVEYAYPETDQDRHAFSAENWDAPIILTTAVQFFESLYAASPSKNRKLHNIAGSVLVFDEAQMLPVPFLKPCLAGICQMVGHFGCTAVLCTATQSAIGPMLSEFAPAFPVRELCPEKEKMYEVFRRVSYVDDGILSDAELIQQMRQRQQVLCVVNRRRQAQTLYAGLADSEGMFHLSTMMTPYDRRIALGIICQRLAARQPCRVVSTSLIEAGVDLDFPEVYRALAGLDSIIQAGGRCNREGKRDRAASVVHIFRTEAKPPQMIAQNINATEWVLRQFETIDAPDVIHAYFHRLFYLKGERELDREDILGLADRSKLAFATIAKRFHLIDGAEYTLYVPLGEGAELVETLCSQGPSHVLLRKLGQFSVTLYGGMFRQLCDRGAVECLPGTDSAGILRDLSLYTRDRGLCFLDDGQGEALFF